MFRPSALKMCITLTLILTYFSKGSENVKFHTAPLHSYYVLLALSDAYMYYLVCLRTREEVVRVCVCV